MPEVQLEPARSANAYTEGGDAVYVSNLLIDWDETQSRFGRDGDKTPINRGCVQHYNTSGIPLGAKLSRAKFEVVATATDSGAFTVDIDVLALNAKLNQTTDSFHDAQFIYLPDHNTFPIQSLWNDGRLTGSDKSIEMKLNIEHGIGSVSQSWVADVSSKSLFAHYWYLQRVGSMSSTTVTTKVYEASGSAGSYTKGDLVDAGQTRSADLIGTSALAAFYTVPAATGGSAWTPDSGGTYISELVFSGGSGSSSIKVGILSTASGGSARNATIHARQSPDPARVLQGFGGDAQWLTGSRIRTAAKSGTTDQITCPNFSSGTTYSFGHAHYAPGTTLTNFTANLQAALDARTSTGQWIGIRLQDFNGTTNDRERYFRSVKHSSATTGSLYGMVLTAHWSLPETISITSKPSVVSNLALLTDSEPDPRTPSETSIANGALVILGERRINDLDENTKSANLIQTRFDDVRDALLRSMTWLFATKRAQLAASPVSPAWGYTNSFPLPFDCLRVLEVDDRWGFGWRVESNAIVTNVEAPLSVTYVARIEDPIKMDSSFRHLFSAALALELAEAITGDSNKLEIAAQRFAVLLKEARVTNGQDESPRDPNLTAWQLWRGEKER